MFSTGDKDLDQVVKDMVKQVESEIKAAESPKVYAYRIQFVDGKAEK
ncbi:hypothetical protein K9N68_27900 [Kovacikia minuta CCNUW1]|nr:hypothetical protein [Kovacikia minuta]UBF25384.1 hypothetical protein K9N68_27900 [Kovacikia minuta CCNUW1]